MHQFKSLPWKTLINTAVITLGISTGLDYGLTLVLPSASQVQIGSLFSSPLGLLFSSIVDMAIGILGVVILEKLMGSRTSIRLPSLWGLILCLLLALVLKLFFPIPGIFLDQTHRISIVGILLGVFAKGQRYWR